MEAKPEYIKLKEPSDVISYVQRVINRIRRENMELEQIGKVTNLLNTWISAYKVHLEATELAELKEQLAEIRARLEGKA